MSEAKRILLVEDEENFGSLLQNYLRLSRYEVVWVKDGAQGYSAFSGGGFDVCIFDVMMPYVDGFTLTEMVRKKNAHTPILFLTARNRKEDVIHGYKLGADDYLTKPFDVEILVLKLDAIFQRLDEAKPSTPQRFVIGNYTYDTATRNLWHKVEERKLSPKEGELMHLLCEYLNQVLPREKALREIWREDSYFTTRSMDVYITKLRKYLVHDPAIVIENVHSSGYMLCVKENSST